MKKRLTVAVVGVGAVGLFAAIGALGTNALFSATGSAHADTITAGTLTVGETTSGTCSISNAYPGQVPQPCALDVTVGGSLNAYMSLKVDITSTAGTGTGATDLYDGTANGLAVSITGSSSLPGRTGQNSVMQFSAPAPNSSATFNVPATTTAASGPNRAFSAGDSETFSVLASLPSWAMNQYQGGSATITLTASLVQYTDNACYSASCSEGNRPYIEMATASAGSQGITLQWNNDLSTSSSYNPPALNNFYVVDWSQSGSTPVFATVNSWSLPTNNTSALTLSALSNGKTIQQNDYLSLFYNGSTSGCTGAGDLSPANTVQTLGSGTQWYANCLATNPLVHSTSSYSINSQMVALFQVGA